MGMNFAATNVQPSAIDAALLSCPLPRLVTLLKAQKPYELALSLCTGVLDLVGGLTSGFQIVS